jgi:hypothetical protein
MRPGFAQKVHHQIGDGTETASVSERDQESMSAMEEYVYEKVASWSRSLLLAVL